MVCGFGLGYLLLSDNRLNEVKRVLKAGGQVAFSVWREQQDQRWLTEIVERYLLNKIDNVNKDKKKVNKLDNVRDVIEALNICGFKNTKGYEENNEVIYRDKEEWWQEMNANAVKGIFDQIEALGTIQYDEFKKEVYLGLERFQRKEGLLFNMPVIYVYGEK